MVTTPLQVCGEVVLRIHHHFLRATAGLSDVKRVYSHAQSLAQCHEWLNKNLPESVERISVASNAEAARLASLDATSAAIAGDSAAEKFGLIKLAENIEDEPNNTTRFLVLGYQNAARSGKDKTSLVISAPNRPGALHALVEPLARNGVSMTKFESRPSRTGLWEYVFFADVDGFVEDAHLQTALKELQDVAAFVKVLGSYPQAVI
jgi:chorismate mutase/prephenate dehydratase